MLPPPPYHHSESVHSQLMGHWASQTNTLDLNAFSLSTLLNRKPLTGNTFSGDNICIWQCFLKSPPYCTSFLSGSQFCFTCWTISKHGCYLKTKHCGPTHSLPPVLPVPNAMRLTECPGSQDRSMKWGRYSLPTSKQMQTLIRPKRIYTTTTKTLA